MKVGFISLGCSKNLIDTEMTIGLFKEHQFNIVNDVEEAEIIVINTCGFIESAKQEAIDTILEMSEFKTHGKCKYLIVMGCLVERYLKELQKSMPEVDMFIPIKEYDKLPSFMKGINNRMCDYNPGAYVIYDYCSDNSGINKGGLGQLVEQYLFGIQNNSESEPDFMYVWKALQAARVLSRNKSTDRGINTDGKKNKKKQKKKK